MSDSTWTVSPRPGLCSTSRTRSNSTASSANCASYLGSTPTRTYWIAPGRVIVLLTVFTKTRQDERREVERARGALTRCVNEHGMTGDE